MIGSKSREEVEVNMYFKLLVLQYYNCPNIIIIIFGQVPHKGQKYE